MASYYLINTVTVGTTKHFPGSLIDDAQHPSAAITAAGGLLWPVGDADVDAAAVKAQTARKAGRNEVELESIMQSAVQQVQMTSDATGSVFAKQVVITLAQINAKGVVASGTFDASEAFPAGARLIGFEGNVTTKLQNVGDTDTTTYEAGTDGASKSAIGIAAGTAADAGISGGAIGAGRAIGGETMRVTITTDTTLDLLTAGGMTVTALYVLPT